MKKIVVITVFLAAGLLDIVGLSSSAAQAQTRTISGNAGVGTAVISRTGSTSTVTSAANGDYSMTVPNHYTGTLTPSKPGYTFLPEGITYTDVTANQPNQHYTATRFGYNISGDAGTSGVTLTWNDTTVKSIQSGTGGAYSIVVSPGWTGTITPSKTGYSYAPVNRSYTNVLADDGGENFTETAITYTISGNTGTGNVSLSYNDNGPKIANSAANGTYSFSVSYDWSGSVTPSKAGYRFVPSGIAYANVLTNQTGQNYTAVRVYTISGDADGAGVTLSWTDTTAKTTVSAGNGNYSIVVPQGWTGTVTPSKIGHSYSPTSRSYTNVMADDGGENYTETAITYTISGNTGEGGVTLSYNDGGAKTKSSNASGDYSFTVSYNWSGIVIPSKTGWAFDPRFIAYTNVLANQSDQDYTASRTWIISGDAGSEGVTLAWTDTIPKTTTAGHNGNYSIVVSNAWTGTVTPSRIGYFYAPETRSYTTVVANDNNEDYAETAGRTIAGNAGVAGAILSWTDGALKSATANGTGTYIITVHNHWTGTVTPALSGYTFAPVGIAYADVTTNQTGKNYTATPFVTVNLKVFLSGPFGAGVMTSALNTAALLPLTSETPYPLATYGAAAKVVGSIPNTEIVDWVLIELRTGTDSASHAAVQAAFVKTDGTVVDANGTDVLSFGGIAHGSYYVVVRHRNHLPVMSAAGVPLDGASVLYDFTTAQTQAFGTNAMFALTGGKFGMIAGDVTRDGTVRFTGAGSDRGAILVVVGFSDPTIPVAGYLDADVNMDGSAKFTGSQSDRGIVLQTVGFADPTIPVGSQVPH